MIPEDPPITINKVLIAVYDLPYLVLPKWYLPSKEETEILDSMQQNYRAEVQWLDAYFSGRNPEISDSNPRLHLTYASAVLRRRLHDICFELVTRGVVGGITPENRKWLHLSMWGQSIVSECRWTLRRINIPNIGTSDIQAKGKEADCKARSQAISTYSLTEKTRKHQRKSVTSDRQQIKLTKVDPKTVDVEVDFWHWLHGQAWNLAKNDAYFRNNFWEPYLTAFATLNNAIKESHSWQLRFILPDGSIFTTGANKRLPKGFAKGKY